MIPIKDDIPSSRFPIVTVIIISLNVIVFLFQFSLGSSNQLLVSSFGAIPYELSHLKDIPPFISVPLPATLLTSMFLCMEDVFFEMIHIPAAILLSFWFLIQLLSGTISLSCVSGGIAWFAHIGGFISGMVFILFFKKHNKYKYPLRNYW